MTRCWVPYSKLFLCCCFLAMASGILFTGCFPPIYEAQQCISWSPDGRRAALVPEPNGDAGQESGVWILDAASGHMVRIFKAEHGSICLYPQWSPFSDELLFCQAREHDAHAGDSGKSYPVSIWIMDGHGRNARMVAQTELMTPFSAMNALAWGADERTILYQKAQDDETAVVIQKDLATGKKWAFLPGEFKAYAFVPSPSREWVAALVVTGDDEDDIRADLYVASFAARNWRRIDEVGVEIESLQASLPMIYWSPDSSVFVINEIEKASPSRKRGDGFLRLFDVRTGNSRRIASGILSSSIRWEGDGRRFLFSCVETGKDEIYGGIFRVDLETGEISAVVAGEELHLMAWDDREDRIFFSESSIAQEKGGKEKRLHRFYSYRFSDGKVAEIPLFFSSDNFGWSLSPTGLYIVLTREANPLSIIDLGHVMLK